MSRLSAQQQKFLDDYIRDTGRIRGRIKQRQATKFLRHKEGLLKSLEKLPQWHQNELNLLVVLAEDKADVGDFKSAYRDLAKAKEEVSVWATRFSAASEIRMLEDDIKNFVAEARPVAATVKDFDAYCVAVTAKDLKEAKAAARAMPKLDEAKEFLSDANSRYEDLAWRLSELERVTTIPSEKEAISRVRDSLVNPLIGELAPLRPMGDRFRTVQELEAQSKAVWQKDSEWGKDVERDVNQDRDIVKQTQEGTQQVPKKVYIDEVPEDSDLTQLDMASGTECLGKFGLVFAKNVIVDGVTYSNPRLLSEGGFGTVVKYTGPGDQSVVLKGVDYYSDNWEKKEKVLEEVRNNRVLAQGNPAAPGRDNVLLMTDCIKGDGNIAYFVMDLAEGGDVDGVKHAMNALSQSGALPEEARNVLNQSIMKQALEGVKYVRDHNMVHFDLKELNLMVMKDGTVKVADFGESIVSQEETGEVDYAKSKTLGYAEPTRLDDPFGMASTKFDTYSLARIMAVMHRGETSAPSDHNKEPVQFEGLTGAIERIHGPMTETFPEDRPVLEAVLGSSYMANLQNYDSEVIQQLMAATVAYGQALRGRQVNNRNAKQLTGEITKKRKEIAQLGKRLKDLDEPRDKDTLKKEWKDKRTELDGLEQDMGALSDDPQVKPHLDQIKDLSRQLQRPPEPVTDVTKFRFIKELTGSIKEAEQFYRFVGLGQYAKLWAEYGVSQPELNRVVQRCYTMRIKDPKDPEKSALPHPDQKNADKNALDQAHHDVDALLNGAKSPVKEAISTGIRPLLESLVMRYQEIHKEYHL